MGTVILYVTVLGLVACLPMILDICLAYHSKNKTRKQLLDEAARNGLEQAELQEFIKEIGKSPPGISGLARATMALTVIVILGIAVIHILVKGDQPEGSQIVNNVLSMLAGLLAAITGFYYGGRTAEKKAEEEKTQPAAKKPPPGSGANTQAGSGSNTTGTNENQTVKKGKVAKRKKKQ